MALEKVEPVWILRKIIWRKRCWGGSGISWTTCKSFASYSRQITTPDASTSSLNYLQAECFSWRPVNSVKALKANFLTNFKATILISKHK